MSLSFTLLLLAELVPHYAAPEAAVLSSMLRPRQCVPTSATQVDLWDRAQRPGLYAYCLALARGYSRLEEQPHEALKAARQANGLIPGQSAPLLLLGQAEARLGQLNQACDSFEAALKIESTAIRHPSTLRDYAVCSLERGNLRAALTAYRQLVRKADLIPEPFERQRALLEASLSLIAFGPAELTEAVSYLGELRRRNPVPLLRPYVLAGLSLALSRQGQETQAKVFAAEADGPWGLREHLERQSSSFGEVESEEGDQNQKLESDAAADAPVSKDRPPTRALVVVPRGEAHALVASLCDGYDAELAVSHWSAYLRTPGLVQPWIEHAKAKLAQARARAGQR